MSHTWLPPARAARSRRHLCGLITTAATTAALVGSAPLPSVAAPPGAAASAAPGTVRSLATGLVAPLSVAVNRRGTRWFSQNFAGVLMRQRPGRPARAVLSVREAEVGAVSVRRGVVTYAVSRGENEEALIRTIRTGRPGARPRTLANLGRAEERLNPDRSVRYGFERISPSCRERLPGFIAAGYRGVDETHPYATLTYGGTTYVADAGANTLWGISERGRVRPVAVIPPAAVRITRSGARSNGLPGCTVGLTYRFEAVPTDVEVGPAGRLYVSTLPGGPEDGSLGENGAVYRVAPRTGRVTRVVSGLASATGLAVGRGGDLYVAELFGGRIVRVPAGTNRKTTFARVPLPADVEVGPAGTYATVDALTGLSGEPGEAPGGRLVRIRR